MPIKFKGESLQSNNLSLKKDNSLIFVEDNKIKFITNNQERFSVDSTSNIKNNLNLISSFKVGTVFNCDNNIRVIGNLTAQSIRSDLTLISPFAESVRNTNRLNNYTIDENGILNIALRNSTNTAKFRNLNAFGISDNEILNGDQISQFFVSNSNQDLLKANSTNTMGGLRSALTGIFRNISAIITNRVNNFSSNKIINLSGDLSGSVSTDFSSIANINVIINNASITNTKMQNLISNPEGTYGSAGNISFTRNSKGLITSIGNIVFVPSPSNTITFPKNISITDQSSLEDIISFNKHTMLFDTANADLYFISYEPTWSVNSASQITYRQYRCTSGDVNTMIVSGGYSPFTALATVDSELFNGTTWSATGNLTETTQEHLGFGGSGGAMKHLGVRETGAARTRMMSFSGGVWTNRTTLSRMKGIFMGTPLGAVLYSGGTNTSGTITYTTYRTTSLTGSFSSSGLGNIPYDADFLMGCTGTSNTSGLVFGAYEVGEKTSGFVVSSWNGSAWATITPTVPTGTGTTLDTYSDEYFASEYSFGGSEAGGCVYIVSLASNVYRKRIVEYNTSTASIRYGPRLPAYSIFTPSMGAAGSSTSSYAFWSNDGASTRLWKYKNTTANCLRAFLNS